MLTILFLIVSFTIGLAVYFHFPAAIVLWLPSAYVYLVNYKGSRSASSFWVAVASIAVFAGGTVLWLPNSIVLVAGTSWFMTLILFTMAALSHGLMSGFVPAALVSRFKNPRATFWALFLGYAVSEIGFVHLLSMNVGELLSAHRIFASVIMTVGTIGLTLCLTSFAMGIAALFCFREVSYAGLLIPLILAVILCPFFSPKTAVSKDGAAEMTAALVQTSSALSPLIDKNYADDILTMIDRSLDAAGAAAGAPPLIVVTPEAGFPVNPTFPWDTDQEKRWKPYSIQSLPRLLTKHRTYLLGAFNSHLLETTFDISNPYSRTIPASFLFSPDGVFLDRVPKRNLIPFIEYIPGQNTIPFLGRIFSWAYGDTEAPTRQVVQVGPFKIASLICYDSMFRSGYWESLKEGADFVFVLTNDFVLGEHGAWYHVQTTRARALEYGTKVIYVGQSGYTGVAGEDFLPWNERAVKLIHVAKDAIPTFYARHVGSWAEPTFSILAGLLFVLSLWIVFSGLARNRRAIVKSLKKGARSEMFWGIAGGALVLWLLNSYVAQFVFVPSGSMEPFLTEGDRAVVCKWNMKEIAPSDVVTFYQNLYRQFLIKRIFLKPGDRYRFNGGRPAINGIPLTARSLGGTLWVQSGGGMKDVVVKSVSENDLWPRADLDVPDGKYFVLGDHRDMSLDSRKWGFLNGSDVTGRLCYKPK